MTWANAFRAVWRRLWRSDCQAYTANYRPTNAVACPTAVTMRRMQLRDESGRLERLQSLRAQIVATHKNDPTRARLESLARAAVNSILSEGVRK
jgi:hypothetical protein